MQRQTLRERFARWLWKAATSRPFTAFWAPGSAYTTTWSYSTYAGEGYASNPYVFRCVRILASCGSMPTPILQRVRQSGDLEEIDKESHEIKRLLANPNSEQGWPEIVETILSYYLIGGQCFTLGVGPSDAAPPKELVTLEPDLVTVAPGDRVGSVVSFDYSGRVASSYKTESRGGRDRNAVWWFKAFDAEEPYQGMPPAAAARYSIDASTMALKYNYSLLKNGGVPGTILHFDAPLKDEDAEAAKRFFEASFAGEKAGGTHVTSGGVTVTPYGLKPSEMSWNDLIEQTATQIACAYSVPPQLVGAKGQLTYNSFREARAVLWGDGVFPLLDRLYASFTRYVNAWFSGGPYVVTYDKDSVDALKEERTQVWDRMNASAFVTLNEKREALGYEKVAGGDVILVPPAQVPLEAVTGGASMTEEA